MVVVFKAGVQEPVIPFSEVIGKAVKRSLAQIGFIGANVGVILGLTVISKVTTVAHCPVVGVNV